MNQHLIITKLQLYNIAFGRNDGIYNISVFPNILNLHVHQTTISQRHLEPQSIRMSHIRRIRMSALFHQRQVH